MNLQFLNKTLTFLWQYIAIDGELFDSTACPFWTLSSLHVILAHSISSQKVSIFAMSIYCGHINFITFQFLSLHFTFDSISSTEGNLFWINRWCEYINLFLIFFLYIVLNSLYRYIIINTWNITIIWMPMCTCLILCVHPADM